MSILASDIKFLLSGGAANEDPNAALGGIISATEVVDDTLQNLFANITGAQHTAGATKYRCIYIKNNSAESAANVKVYLNSNTPGVDSAITIGLDLAGVGDGASTGVADTVANEDTAPSPAVTFTSADGFANALSVGAMTAGQVIAVWVKLVITAGSTAQANDNAVIKVSVDTL